MRNGILFGVGSLSAVIVVGGLAIMGYIFASGAIAFTFAAICLSIVSVTPSYQRLSEAMLFASIPLLLASVGVSVLGSHIVH